MKAARSTGLPIRVCSLRCCQSVHRRLKGGVVSTVSTDYTNYGSMSAIAIPHQRYTLSLVSQARRHGAIPGRDDLAARFRHQHP